VTTSIGALPEDAGQRCARHSLAAKNRKLTKTPMDETRHSPLEDLLPWALPAEDGNLAVSLGELRFVHQIGLRRRPPTQAYISGVPLPLQPNRVAVMRGVRTLWLGPDEWLITAAEGAAPDP